MSYHPRVLCLLIVILTIALITIADTKPLEVSASSLSSSFIKAPHHLAVRTDSNKKNNNNNQSSIITIKNCTDVVGCSSATCKPILSLRPLQCVPMTSAVSNFIMPGKYLKVFPLLEPGLCSPTEVFFGDPTCKNISAMFWTPDGTCLQYSPRLQTAKVVRDQFRVFVQSCSDANCLSCGPISPDDHGLPPGECYPHPGVPGLFLRYPNLESCTQYHFLAFEDEKSCMETVFSPDVDHVTKLSNNKNNNYKTMIATTTSQSIFAGQGKCFNGLALDLE